MKPSSLGPDHMVPSPGSCPCRPCGMTQASGLPRAQVEALARRCASEVARTGDGKYGQGWVTVSKGSRCGSCPRRQLGPYPQRCSALAGDSLALAGTSQDRQDCRKWFLKRQLLRSSTQRAVRIGLGQCRAGPWGWLQWTASHLAGTEHSLMHRCLTLDLELEK